MGITDSHGKRVEARRAAREAITDVRKAEQVEECLADVVRKARRCLAMVDTLVREAPNTKAGVISALGANASEAVTIIELLTDLVNTHKMDSAPAAVVPFTSADVR